MNTAELKLEIIRQVDLLEVDVLNEIREFIHNRIRVRNLDVSKELTDAQRFKIEEAQRSLREGRGISHEEIKAKYRSRYGGA
jgi:hypothetical protein